MDPKRPMQEDGTLHTAPSHDPDPLTPSASVGPRPSGGAGRADSSAQQQQALGTSHSSHDPLGDPLGGLAGTSPPTQPPHHHDANLPTSGSGRVSQGSGLGGTSSPSPAVRVSSSPFKQQPESAAAAPAAASQQQLEQARRRREQQEAEAEEAASDPLFVRDVTADDHPLSLDAGSRWRTFFQDNETLEQITRDVMRTHPDMEFFTGESEEAELHRQVRRLRRRVPGACGASPSTSPSAAR